MKAITLVLAVSMMSISMTLALTPDSQAFMVPFLVNIVVNFFAAVPLFKNVIEPAQAPAKANS